MMGVTDLPIEIGAGRSPAEHIDDHLRLHHMSHHAIYSDWHSSLQDAVDTAITRGRPLIIQPGTRALDAPLRISNTSRLHIIADRATITSTESLPSLIDMSGVAFCQFSGLTLMCDAAVDTALYIHHSDNDTTPTTTCLFNNTLVQGHYGVGVRVGAPGDTTQCDMMRFIHTALIQDGHGDSTGLHLGSDIHANNLAHAIWGLNASGHARHVVVSGTNATIDACSFARSSQADFFLSSASFVAIRGVRSEVGARFIDSSGGATYAAQVSVSDVEYWAQYLSTDARWLVFNKGGVLSLSNIKVLHPAVTPILRAVPTVPLALRVTGLLSEVALKDAFDLSASVRATVDDYVQIDSGVAAAVNANQWSGGAWAT